jgi:hypothetical protein
MKLICNSPNLRSLLAATMLVVTAGSGSALAAEHFCGDVGVTVVPAPVPGGTAENNCGTAWATCGVMQLTIKNEPVIRVAQYVAVQQSDGRYGPMVETNQCSQTFGTCAWAGPPQIAFDGDRTVITQTLKSWVPKDGVATWKQAKLYAYCD